MSRDFIYEQRNYTKFAVLGLACILLIITIVIIVLFNRPISHNYIAIGDSVSSGYGLPGYIGEPEGRHTNLLFEKLEQAGYVDEYYNFATSGFTTTDLLNQLNNKSRSEKRLFRDARVVTINIGGNNILTPFLAYLEDLQSVAGFENLEVGVERTLSGAWGIIYEVALTIVDEDATSPDAEGLRAGLEAILTGIGTMIIGLGEIVIGSPEAINIWRGALPPELEAMFAEGVQTFNEELEEIISWLESNAPNATIIINTVHNPIPQEIMMISVPISNWSYALITYMNQTTLEKSQQRGFLVTDVNAYLSQRLYLTSFNINPLVGPLSLDLVHPNEEGHRLIAELNYDTFMRNINLLQE